MWNPNIVKNTYLLHHYAWSGDSTFKTQHYSWERGGSQVGETSRHNSYNGSHKQQISGSESMGFNALRDVMKVILYSFEVDEIANVELQADQEEHNQVKIMKAQQLRTTICDVTSFTF